MDFLRKVFSSTNANNSATKSQGGAMSVRSHTRYHDFAMRRTLWNFLAHCLHDVEDRTNKESVNFDQMQVIQNMLFDDNSDPASEEFIDKHRKKSSCYGYRNHNCRFLTFLNRHNADIIIDRSKNERLPPLISSNVEEGNIDFTVRFRKMEQPQIEEAITEAAFHLATDTIIEIKQFAKIFVPHLLLKRLTEPGALIGTGVLRIRLKNSEKFFIMPCRYFQHVSPASVPEGIYHINQSFPITANDFRYHAISYGWNFITQTVEPCMQTEKNMKTNMPFSAFELNEDTVNNLNAVRPNKNINIDAFEKAFLDMNVPKKQTK
ncbi:hypothetical protein SNEBB_003333 [Seison nebaliae]|nr:hypothetical protein SNEBB_003333 [Seison nebaliae]